MKVMASLAVKAAYLELAPAFADRVDSRQLFRLLETWVPDKRVRDQILVENPQRCFGF